MQTMGASQEGETSSMERPSEIEAKVENVKPCMAVGDSERLADQFLMLGLPLESEVCKQFNDYQDFYQQC